jgi:nucleotide-binding universal stress UspA family protein
MSAFRKILVPTDFSRHSREAFRVAHDLAKPTGASMVMFHVSRPHAVVSDGNRPLSAPAHTEAKDVGEQLLQIQAKVHAVRIEHEMIVADPPDAKHILRTLRERGCDLIVMGTRCGRGGSTGCSAA